jgi:hypothetical protein
MIKNQVAVANRPAPQIGQVWYPPRQSQTGRVFADAPLNDNRFYQWGGYQPYNPPRGYGLDLNNDGKFDAKNDGFLTFDLNRDGKHTDQEITQSRNLLKAFSGDFDVNADGRVDYGEMFQGYSNFFQARSMDLDRDGILSKWELQKAGGSVVQKNNDQYILNASQTGPVADQAHFGGQTEPLIARDFSPWRSFSLDSLPNGQRLDYLNPWNRSFVSSRPDWRFFATTNELPNA